MNSIIEWAQRLWNLRVILKHIVELLDEHAGKLATLIEEHKKALKDLESTRKELQAIEDVVTKPDQPTAKSYLHEALDKYVDDVVTNPFSTMTVDPMEDAIQRSRDDRGLC